MNFTAQQIFDTVINHLRSMKQRAMQDGRCCYMTDDGAKCAVGILLTSIEAVDMGLQPITYNNAPERLQPHVGLLKDLQELHDQSDNWNEDGISRSGEMFAKNIAMLWFLKYTPPNP